MWYIILALIALFQGVSFMVPLPQPIYYGTILLGFLVTVGKVDKFNKSIFFFLLVAVFGIFYNNIPSFFKSEQRLLIFIVVVSAIGPLFISRKSHVFRIKLFVILNRFIVVLSCLSFITYILGVSLPFSATGKNSGFFVHSLTLGPFAAVSFLLLVYVLYSKINVLNISTKILKICLFLSIMALLISSSRTSIIALVFALLFLSYKMYRHKVGKTFKMMFGLVIILSLSYPLWSTYTSGIISKFESTDNDLLASREAHWNSRLLEFKTSPIMGVGFASALTTGEFAIGFNEESGGVEPGSSWLAVLSMTGLLGFLFIAIIFLSPLFFLFRDKLNFGMSGILGSLLVFFMIHMNAEGYILAAGSLLFFYIWLLLGVIVGYKKYGVLKII